MLLKRKAFSFLGSLNNIRTNNYPELKVNIAPIVEAVEETCNLLDVGGKFIRYCCEKQKINEVYKQIAYMKNMLDMRVEEEEIRSEIAISEAYKRAELDLINYKTEIRNELDYLRVSVSQAQQKHINNSELERIKRDSQEKIRKLIVKRMYQIKKWIDKLEHEDGKTKIYYELEEQLRTTSEQYSKLIEKII